MTSSAFPLWPITCDFDQSPDDRATQGLCLSYGIWARPASPRRLCPDPTTLPVRRFLTRPPVGPPVPVPDDLPFDPIAYATARRVLGLVLEVLDRRRPLIQLRPVLTPHAVRYLSVVTDWLPVTAQRGDACVLSIRMCQPANEVAEVAAVCRLGGRVRAIAARFECKQHASSDEVRWRCAVIQLG
jgi:hypothetical protein